jgi:hypothetical protein
MKSDEEYDFDYVYSKLLVRELDEKYLNTISLIYNGKDLILNKLNNDVCDTHRDSNKPYIKDNGKYYTNKFWQETGDDTHCMKDLDDSFYHNTYWLIELGDEKRIKRPCVVLEKYFGIRNDVKYSKKVVGFGYKI